jgi:hypothetical protein
MPSNAGLLTPAFPSPTTIAADVGRDGFALYSGAVRVDALEQMKEFWVGYFGTSRPSRRAVRSNLRLGDENFNSYSDDALWCLFRDFDFLWNRPTHALTRDLAVEIHRVRNRSQGFDDEKGLAYSSDRYGMYVSTSFYPVDSGRLRGHEDGHQGTPILQYMVPFTHKGIDYDDGGLFVHDAQGKKVDIDAVMKPGDVVFFDGRIKHGVDTIRSRAASRRAGRVASFAITTYFRTRAELPATLRHVEDLYLDVAQRFKGKTKGDSAY